MQLKPIHPTPCYCGASIRVLVDESNNHAPWFVAVDTARAIGLPDSNAHVALRRLDQKDITRYSTPGKRGPRSVNLVSEPGFYELVLGSRKPGAVAFKRWVCSEVLPEIRKYGQYQAKADEENNPINIPDVLVEMVHAIPGGHISENGPRLGVRDYLEIKNIQGINRKNAQFLGKIARRLLLTYDLPIIRTWKPYIKTINRSGRWGTYPEKILDMAYDQFLKGRRD